MHRCLPQILHMSFSTQNILPELKLYSVPGSKKVNVTYSFSGLKFWKCYSLYKDNNFSESVTTLLCEYIIFWLPPFVNICKAVCLTGLDV